MADEAHRRPAPGRLPQQLAWAVALLAILAAGAAWAAEGARLGRFDFGYLASGDSQIRPVQVFDDGHDTFLQFRPGATVPAIFGNSADGPQLLTPQQQGPYLKLPELHPRLLLQLGRAQALVLHGSDPLAEAALQQRADAGASARGRETVDRQGSAALALLPALAMTPGTALVDDDQQRNSYATPRRGDAVRWPQPGSEEHEEHEERDVWFLRSTATLSARGRQALAAAARGLPGGARLVLIGRDDDSDQPGLDQRRAAAMRQVLAKAGVPPPRMDIQVGPPAAHKDQEWASSLLTELPSALRPNPEPGLRASLQALVRAGALRLDDAEALARSQWQAPVGVVAADRPAAAAISSWDMRQSDGSVEKMLRRWAVAAGWTLVWDQAPAIPVSGDLRLPPSGFLVAADQVLRRAQELGYRIRATAYSNQTLVVETP